MCTPYTFGVAKTNVFSFLAELLTKLTVELTGLSGALVTWPMAVAKFCEHQAYASMSNLHIKSLAPAHSPDSSVDSCIQRAGIHTRYTVLRFYAPTQRTRAVHRSILH